MQTKHLCVLIHIWAKCPSGGSSGSMLFCGSFLLFIFRVFLSVHCSFVVTCWERADLLALLNVMFIVFCPFPMWCPGSGVVHDYIDS